MFLDSTSPNVALNPSPSENPATTSVSPTKLVLFTMFVKVADSADVSRCVNAKQATIKAAKAIIKTNESIVQIAMFAGFGTGLCSLASYLEITTSCSSMFSKHDSFLLDNLQFINIKVDFVCCFGKFPSVQGTRVGWRLRVLTKCEGDQGFALGDNCVSRKESLCVHIENSILIFGKLDIFQGVDARSLFKCFVVMVCNSSVGLFPILNARICKARVLIDIQGCPKIMVRPCRTSRHQLRRHSPSRFDRLFCLCSNIFAFNLFASDLRPAVPIIDTVVRIVKNARNIIFISRETMLMRAFRRYYSAERMGPRLLIGAG